MILSIPQSPHLLVILLLLLPANASRAEERPNIVFLLADDQCTYSMGCYGTPNVKTPNLDRLAHDGVVFDRHYTTTAICMASRATIMTGMYEYKTGCNFTHGPLWKKHWTKAYPLLLRSANYQTAFAGKFGFLVALEPEGKGILPQNDFDMWGGGPGQTSYETKKNKSMVGYADRYPHSTLSYAAFSHDFIRKASKNSQPFCLSISFKAPHRPVHPDPTFDNVYEGTNFIKPANFGRRYGEHFSKQSRHGRQFERFHSWNYSSNYNSVMALYYQQIFAIDVAIGRIRESLMQFGVADNTVIIYTSDNGFLCGSHGYGSKVLPYEESSRVPLLIYDPRHKNSGKQIRCQALTGNIDFAPTILQLAKITVPRNMDGRSLLALYDDPNEEIHSSISLINVWGPPQTHSLSVVTKDWKYIYWPFQKGALEATEEIYNLASDPLELTNLANSSTNRRKLNELRKTYDLSVAKWRKEAVPYHNYRGFESFFARQK